jgi:hypothetical protein
MVTNLLFNFTYAKEDQYHYLPSLAYAFQSKNGT